MSSYFVEALVRINEDAAKNQLLSAKDFRNKLLIAFLTTKRQYQEDLNDGTTIAALLLSIVGFDPFVDVTATWRIMAQIKTTQDPIMIKVPIYDSKVQTFVRSCVYQ